MQFLDILHLTLKSGHAIHKNNKLGMLIFAIGTKHNLEMSIFEILG